MSVDAATRYVIGDLVKITARFQDVTGAFIQPTAVNCEVMDPAGNITHPGLTFDSSLETPDLVIEPGYYTEIDTTPGPFGMWHYRIWSTGAGQAAQEGQFYVEPSKFS